MHFKANYFFWCLRMSRSSVVPEGKILPFFWAAVSAAMLVQAQDVILNDRTQTETPSKAAAELVDEGKKSHFDARTFPEIFNKHRLHQLGGQRNTGYSGVLPSNQLDQRGIIQRSAASGILPPPPNYEELTIGVHPNRNHINNQHQQRSDSRESEVSVSPDMSSYANDASASRNNDENMHHNRRFDSDFFKYYRITPLEKGEVSWQMVCTSRGSCQLMCEPWACDGNVKVPGTVCVADGLNCSWQRMGQPGSCMIC